MVVGNPHIVGISIAPAKEDPPLLIDADAPKSLQIAREGFQPIGWRQHQLLQLGGLINAEQFHVGAGLNIRRKRAGAVALEDLRGLLVTKASDHPETMVSGGYVVKLGIAIFGNSPVRGMRVKRRDYWKPSNRSIVSPCVMTRPLSFLRGRVGSGGGGRDGRRASNAPLPWHSFPSIRDIR